MEIKIFVFGSLIDIMGHSSVQIHLNEIDIQEPSQHEVKYEVQTLIEFLKMKFPSLKNMKFLVSVDRKIVHENATLHPHSEIAILPPFSGG